jgi:hypothetical protein
MSSPTRPEAPETIRKTIRRGLSGVMRSVTDATVASALKGDGSSQLAVVELLKLGLRLGDDLPQGPKST